MKECSYRGKKFLLGDPVILSTDIAGVGSIGIGGFNHYKNVVIDESLFNFTKRYVKYDSSGGCCESDSMIGPWTECERIK